MNSEAQGSTHQCPRTQYMDAMAPRGEGLGFNCKGKYRWRTGTKEKAMLYGLVSFLPEKVSIMTKQYALSSWKRIIYTLLLISSAEIFEKNRTFCLVQRFVQR
jgi:hypothetical protein